MTTLRSYIVTRDWFGLAILLFGGTAYCALVIAACAAIVHGVRPLRASNNRWSSPSYSSARS